MVDIPLHGLHHPESMKKCSRNIIRTRMMKGGWDKTRRLCVFVCHKKEEELLMHMPDTHTKLCNHDVDQTPHHDQGVERIPSINKIVLEKAWERLCKTCIHFFCFQNNPWELFKRYQVRNVSHVWSQSEQFDDHLNGEERGEDHVQDVHDRVEELWLLIMLMWK